MTQWTMTDAEYLESAPRFLGVTLGSGLAYVLLGHSYWLYFTFGLMVLLMFRLAIVHTIASFFQEILKFIGQNLVWIVLSVLYLFLITPYAVLVRWLGGNTTHKFFKITETTTSFQAVDTKYDKKFFEKTW